jgi:hypothetical protein
MSPSDRAAHLRTLRGLRIESCAKLVLDLMHHKQNHGVFNIPVDAVALCIPDYHKVIKQPMDLGTVRARMERHQCVMFANAAGTATPSSSSSSSLTLTLTLAGTRGHTLLLLFHTDGCAHGPS